MKGGARAKETPLRRYGAEEADREERKAGPGGRKLRSAYLSIVGENPDLLPGDWRGAGEMLRRVEQAIELGGWTRSEWSRLYRMREKWRLRRDGKDARFEVAGNKRGVLAENLRAEVQLRAAVNEIRRQLDGEKSEW